MSIHCRACQLLEQGVKTLVEMEHTCGLPEGHYPSHEEFGPEQTSLTIRSTTDVAIRALNRALREEGLTQEIQINKDRQVRVFER